MSGAALWLGLLTGCGPSDPLDQVLKARTPVDLTFRRTQLGRALTSAQRQDLDAALLELKYDIMVFAEAKGAEAITSALLDKIHALTLREIIGLGLSAKLRRLEAERDKLQAIVDHNARLRTRPEDWESADYLRHVRDEQAFRFGKVSETIEKTRSRLAALRDQPIQPEPAEPPPSASPGPGTPPRAPDL